MRSIRPRVLNGEVLAGTWLVLGSSLSAEIAGKAGFDWVLVDMEHGMGDLENLLFQLQAVDATPAQAIVRVAWNEPPLVKRVLDWGPSGVMIPYVSTAAEAQQAARSLRYPPQGVRGLTPLSRPAEFGARLTEYFQEANDQLLTVVQIETALAVKNADEIAAVDGVDVLFIGPMDLSLGMGVFRQFDHPDFRAAVAHVVRACRNHGKAAGILLLNPAQIENTVQDGFTFIAMSSDGGLLASGMRDLAAPFQKYKKA